VSIWDETSYLCINDTCSMYETGNKRIRSGSMVFEDVCVSTLTTDVTCTPHRDVTRNDTVQKSENDIVISDSSLNAERRVVASQNSCLLVTVDHCGSDDSVAGSPFPCTCTCPCSDADRLDV